jgi:HEAT repeat protein
MCASKWSFVLHAGRAAMWLSPWQSAAAVNLGRMGPGAASAAPQLLVTLQDEDQFVRLGAVCALGSICPDDDVVLAALAAALKDSSPMVRRRTLNILAELGPRSLAALTAISEALKDGEPEVCQAAADALDKIKRQAK